MKVTMKNQPSFVLVPAVYNNPCQAELHLVVVNDNGVKLGILATASTAYHLDGSRNIHVENMTELQKAEQAVVIERIKREKSLGNIDKAFAGDISNHTKEFSEVIDLFQFPPTVYFDEVEQDRIQKLLDTVRCGYLEV